MFEMREKVILTDVDGVLLDWTYSFTRYMDQQYGRKPVRFDTYNMAKAFDVTDDEIQAIISRFNESIHIRNLTPKGDAIKYVKKLHEEHGFVFHAITAVGDDRDTRLSRIENLNRLFGNTAFEEVFCVGRGTYAKPGESKRHILEKYKDTGCMWIEDHHGHAVDGLELGLNALLMDSFHNRGWHHPDIPRVTSWREIYELTVQR